MTDFNFPSGRFGHVNLAIPVVPGPTSTYMIYRGTWNATTNTPTFSSGAGTRGDVWKVSVAGTTNLNGITQWNVGDYAFFDGTVWNKITGSVLFPVLATVAYSGQYADVIGTPVLAAVALSGAFGDLSGVPAFARLDTNQAWTKGQAVTPVNLVDLANVAVNAANSNSFVLTATGAVGNTRQLSTPSNLKNGQFISVLYIQDNVGGRALTFDANYKFSGGSAVSLLANATSLITGVYFVATGFVHCTVNKDFT